MKVKNILMLLLAVVLASALSIAVSVEENLATNANAPISKQHSYRLKNEFHFDLSKINRAVPTQLSATGLFKPKSWQVKFKSEVIAAYVNTPQVVAPPVPFVYIGRLVDANETTVFLFSRDHQFAVKEKDILDNTYRIEKIGESEIALTYIPTNTKQSLQISNISDSKSFSAFQN